MSVSNEREWYHGDQHYTGELLDGMSTRIVRSEISKRVYRDWGRFWVNGFNKINRNRLVYDLMRKLDAYWSKRSADGIYSPAAVAEEVDYYLPKSFWKRVRKRKGSAAGVVVDVDGVKFANWVFRYEETKDRLRLEFARRVEDADRYNSRKKAIVFDSETGEIIEERSRSVRS